MNQIWKWTKYEKNRTCGNNDMNRLNGLMQSFDVQIHQDYICWKPALSLVFMLRQNKFQTFD